MSGPGNGRVRCWVCLACGKVAEDEDGKGCPGWDESCMLNSREVYADKLVTRNGRAVQVLDGGLVEQAGS